MNPTFWVPPSQVILTAKTLLNIVVWRPPSGSRHVIGCPGIRVDTTDRIVVPACKFMPHPLTSAVYAILPSYHHPEAAADLNQHRQEHKTPCIYKIRRGEVTGNSLVLFPDPSSFGLDLVRKDKA